MGEKELFSIAEGLKAFEGVIRCTDLTVHTDHLNLLYQKYPSQRMIRWRRLVEEYHPKFVHVRVLQNNAADVLSRLQIQEKNADTVDWEPKNKRLTYPKAAELNQLCRFYATLDIKGDSDETLFDLESSESQIRYFVSDKSWNSEFSLDVRMFKKHQERDQGLVDAVLRSV